MRRGLKRNIVLALGLLADTYTGLTRSAFYRRLWWEDYKKPSVYATISRMVKVGEIEREVDEKGRVVLKLRARGSKLFDEALPLHKLQKKKWDGKWRLVAFDVEEKKRKDRDLLRWKLQELGFGQWQRSVYVTPHAVMDDVNEYLEAQALGSNVVCFESWRVGRGDDNDFADMVFGTDEINSEYEDLYDKAQALGFVMKQNSLSWDGVENRLRRLWMGYLDLLEEDPFLPYDLLPEPWYADKARDAIQDLMREFVRSERSKKGEKRAGRGKRKKVA